MSGSIDLFGNDIPEPVVETPAKRKRFTLFDDFIPDITQHKKNLLRLHPEAVKDLSPFIINTAMSMHIDTVLYANEMNTRHWASPQMLYDYYIHTIRPAKRYGWAKKSKTENLDLIMEYYGYSEKKALDALSLLTESDIERIKNKMNKGGKQ